MGLVAQQHMGSSSIRLSPYLLDWQTDSLPLSHWGSPSFFFFPLIKWFPLLSSSVQFLEKCWQVCILKIKNNIRFFLRQLNLKLFMFILCNLKLYISMEVFIYLEFFVCLFVLMCKNLKYLFYMKDSYCLRKVYIFED